jgi:trk system potassium uptake protein
MNVSAISARLSLRSWSPPRLRPVLHLISRMLIVLAAAMLVPALADLATRDPDWKSFLLGSAVTLVCGTGLYYVTRCRLSGGLTIRQAFVLTPVAYVTLCLFAALPLYISDYSQLRDNFTNAFFETMSGLTTTGASVIVGLDNAPAGLLLWRALLQWLGGIGVIGVAIAILPTLGVGGMQLFRTESSDRSEKVMPRVREIATAITFVYIGLTVACGLLYWVAGMTAFEALTHALTTVSTAGFSTSDQSMSNFGHTAQWVAVAFMLAGSLPFVLYVRFIQGEWNILRSSQVKTLLGFLGVVVVGMTAWLVMSGRYAFGDAFRLAAFNVVSIVTTLRKT